MARYFCKFKVTEKTDLTEAQTRQHIFDFWDEKEMIGWVFDNQLNTRYNIDEIDLIEDLIELSKQLPDTRIWIDAYVSTTEIYRTYAKNGKTRHVNAILEFPEPTDEEWMV